VLKRSLAGFVLLITIALLFSQQNRTTAASDLVLYAAEAARRAGTWRVVPDSTAAGGSRLEQPNAGAPQITPPLANPQHYVEYPIVVEAGVPYHLWLRGKAENNSGDNDSVWVQTSATVDANGAPVDRIGTTSATMVNLKGCTACSLSGWGWQDNSAYNETAPGPSLTFATGGTQTLRIQAREDGVSIDQIVLSSTTYLNRAPGAAQNDTTILPNSGGGSSITLVRGPYLQQVSDTGAVVVWATRQSDPASVVYWTGSQTPLSVNATSTFRSSSSTGIPDYYQHEATLSGLAANTTYQYDLRVHGADVTPNVTDRFKTAPLTGTGTVRFVAFGDSGAGTAEQSQVATRILGETFDFAVHTGDVAYSSGTYAEFESRFFPYYGPWLRAKGIFPVIGNHDDITGSATPYRTLFVLPREGASSTFPNNAERFYSVDYGPLHLVALDTEAAFQSSARRAEQLAWLEADLQASQNRPWRVVFFHRPPFSSGTEHGSDLAVRQAFVPLFERYNVELVLTGHEHSYERTIPWKTGTGAANQPVVYIVTGGGGAGLYPVGHSAWTAFSRSVHHYLRANATTAEITIEAVGVDGIAFDGVTLAR
jgi:Calcineurin-like phosphoesterase/Purple acid Phosphatase, N-terminal domain